MEQASPSELGFVARIKKHLVQVRTWARKHPVMATLCALMLGLVMAVQVAALMQSQRDSQELARVSSLPSLSMKYLFSEAQKGQVKEILTHDLRGGTLISPESRQFAEVIFKDGRHMALEQVPELQKPLWEGLAAMAKDTPVAFRKGYVADRENRLSGFLGTVLTVGLILGLLFGAQMLMGQRMASQGFKAHKRDEGLLLDDVIGYEDVKRELREVVDQLTRAPEYIAQGIKPPRGIIFTGDPGVGKTMMAKALANELKAEFLYCTGADFAEMYVGVGPKRVKSLFARARQSKLAFIFIDEIDALGSRSSAGQDTERQATINQFLAEMDGVNENGQILVLGATNHVDRLDSALLRPGRFDKQIYIPLPDRSTREGILRKYVGQVDQASCVDFHALSLRTQGFSGAQLRAMVNEAKNLSMRAAKARGETGISITQELLERAQEIAILGISEHRAEGEEAKRIAVHELGHALVGYLCCSDIFIEKVTTIGRGRAGGYTLSRPLTEGALKTQECMRGEIAMMLAGRAAEEVVLGSVSSGASDDLSRANRVARRMVCQLGMGPSVGLVTPADNLHPGSPMPVSVDTDVKNLLEEIYGMTKAIIQANFEWVHSRAQHLLEHGLMGHDALFQGIEKPPTRTLSTRATENRGVPEGLVAACSNEKDRSETTMLAWAVMMGAPDKK